MSKIDTRPSFFPKSRSATELANDRLDQLKKRQQADKLRARTKDDAQVDISNVTKDFARIKKVAIEADPAPRQEKIAKLKADIKTGQYQVDYDGLAQKVLEEEFLS